MNATKIKKIFLISTIILVCVVSTAYWLYEQLYVSTDDAYVNANVVQISSRVTGSMKRLYVTNNQYVKAGQPLLDLDPATYQAAVLQYQAALQLAEAKVALAQINATRMLALSAENAISKQAKDTAIADLKSAIAQENAAKAELISASLNLQYTHIVAPTSGWISDISIREGATVTANQPLFALVSDEEFWVDANFKETQIHHIIVGQQADIKIDMYPGQHFQGIVESFSSGSGNVFSLLPPENATGNWVKVVQRVPVRIKIIHYNSRNPLRIGTSATVKILRRSMLEHTT
jgi:membrane fusion protein (multidrug efflux system)